MTTPLKSQTAVESDPVTLTTVVARGVAHSPAISIRELLASAPGRSPCYFSALIPAMPFNSDPDRGVAFWVEDSVDDSEWGALADAAGQPTRFRVKGVSGTGSAAQNLRIIIPATAAGLLRFALRPDDDLQVPIASAIKLVCTLGFSSSWLSSLFSRGTALAREEKRHQAEKLRLQDEISVGRAYLTLKENLDQKSADFLDFEKRLRDYATCDHGACASVYSLHGAHYLPQLGQELAAMDSMVKHTPALLAAARSQWIGEAQSALTAFEKENQAVLRAHRFL
jgi:hypothetical protein